MVKLGTAVLCGLFCLQQGYGLHPIASLTEYRHSVSLDSNQALVPLSHILTGHSLRHLAEYHATAPCIPKPRAFLRLPAARALEAVESKR